MNNQEVIDEGFKSVLTTSLISLVMSIPGLVKADDIKTQLNKLNPNQIVMTGKHVQNIIKNSQTDKNMYGGYSATNCINMIARTVFQEGKGETELGRKYILLSIIERANNSMDKVPSVIMRKKAYSCWNAMTPGDWKNFKYKVPKEAFDKDSPEYDIWLECVKLATQFYNGSFKKPTTDHINSYYNPDKVTPSWASQLTNKTTVGNHVFGYLKSEDPNAKKNNKTIQTNKSQTYTVVKNDNLTKIAKKFNTTVKSLLALNNLKIDSILQIGQVIKVN